MRWYWAVPLIVLLAMGYSVFAGVARKLGVSDAPLSFGPGDVADLFAWMCAFFAGAVNAEWGRE